MMRERRFRFGILAGCALVGACFSLKIPHLRLPESYIESVELCRKVEFRGDHLSPVEPRTVFGPRDDVICFIRLRNVPGKTRLRWKWYAPDQSLVRDTGDVEVHVDETALDMVTASDPLRPSSPMKTEGDWTVCVFINDTLAWVQKFVTKN